MNVFQRLTESVRHDGLAASVVKLCVWSTDYFFDLRNGLDTCKCSPLEGLTIGGENKERGTRYQPSRVMPLRKLFRLIEPLVPANSVLVDLGCGKGRVLLVASEFGFKEVRGVEFAHELSEIAKKNCAVFKTRRHFKPNYRIIESDVTQYTIEPDETVFFMFNPFDEIILQKVLGNITASLRMQPRRILIIYYNPRAAQTIEKRDDFTELQEFNFWGYHFKVYSNHE